MDLRHIAVCPNINSNGEITLDPVLIDFGNMKKLNNPNCDDSLLIIEDILDEYLDAGYTM